MKRQDHLERRFEMLHLVMLNCVMLQFGSGTQQWATKDVSPISQAVEALRVGDAKRLTELLDKNPGLANASFQDMPLLLWAIDSRVPSSCFKVLLEHGSDYNARYDDSGIGVALASDRFWRWPVPIAKTILSVQDQRQLEKVSMIKKLDPSLLLKPSRNGVSPFVAAVQSDWLKTAEAIRTCGVTSSDPDNAGAVSEVHTLRAAKYLVQHGFSADGRNRRGENALFYAGVKPAEIWRYLIDHGAQVAARSNTGETPIIKQLHIRGTYGGSYDLLEFLLREPRGVTSRDREGRTALFFAKYNFQMAKLVIDAGSDVNAKAYNGYPVLWAMVIGFPDKPMGFTGTPYADWDVRRKIVQYMASKKVDLNVLDKSDETILDKALKLQLPDEVTDLRLLGAKLGWEIVDERQQRQRRKQREDGGR